MKHSDKLNSKESGNTDQQSAGNWIRVGMSTCGVAAGADEVFTVLQQEVARRQLDVRVAKCGCLGMCYAEPLVEVKSAGLPATVYSRVDKKTALDIIEQHVTANRLVNDHIIML